jgi:hypothetical protein
MMINDDDIYWGGKRALTENECVSNKRRKKNKSSQNRFT